MIFSAFHLLTNLEFRVKFISSERPVNPPTKVEATSHNLPEGMTFQEKTRIADMGVEKSVELQEAFCR
ncbi:MAG: hypothetical protein WC560_02015 [Syntrophales bacterium]